MPALLGQSITNLADSQRAIKSSSMYITYMNAHVFQPVGIPASECKPPVNAVDILSYTFPAGTNLGTDWGDWSLKWSGPRY
jgi:hypothetical protein